MNSLSVCWSLYFCRCAKKSADNSEKFGLSPGSQNRVFSSRQPSFLVSVDKFDQWIRHTRICSCHQWKYDGQKPCFPLYSE